ncbi:hypothetical protein [Pelagicoccus sp. SDUM812005]|uniref:hypothetical protein n=1 Tax=Pelagicoccus sp. SDUM812005 TaxID=3041257 RepID=UPI0028125C1D|nr:hypothetical protein [Pelagicoccus sp. SDUM812005]
MTSYLVFWIVMFLILGAFWYVVDRKYGQGVYRFWYRLTHEKPLPESVQRGFVYNRKTRHKALMATLLSTAQSIVAVMSVAEPNLLVELILWIVEVPVTLLGFAIGPWVFGIWRRKDEVFDAIDDLESGDKTIGDVFGKAEKAKAKPQPPAKKLTASPEKKDGDDDDDIDPREMIRRYTKR